jgi:Tfp pilus assembly protein PilE
VGSGIEPERLPHAIEQWSKASSNNGMNRAGHDLGRTAKEKAYTLAEVMISVLIVGTLILSLYAGFSQGFSVIQSSRENLRATQILVQRMETIRLYTWSQSLDTTKYLQPSFVDYYDPRGRSNNTAGLVYQGTITSEIPLDLPVAYQADMRTITVRLYWTNFNQGEPIVFSRQMQTRVARNGIQNYIYGK